MRPILYGHEEKRFVSMGKGVLSDAISCYVTEERNGVYECKLQYPITGAHFDELQNGVIIGCTHDDKGDIQPFEIYGRSAPINGVVTFYAHHISYRLSNVILSPYTAGSCVEAIAGFTTHNINDNPFTFWTDKAVTGNFSLNVPKSVRQVLGGEAGSLLDVYGTGEYEFDKWTVKLHLHRGQDNGVKIRYGVNLIDLNQEQDSGNTYSAVVPYWKGSEDDVVTLPEYVVVADNVQDQYAPLTGMHGTSELPITTESGTEITVVYKDIVIVPMDLTDAFQNRPTETQLRNTARTRINNSQARLEKNSIEINFAALWQTAEYEQYAALQRVGLCDTVGIIYTDLGINTSAKVVSVEYDVLLERYSAMVIGDATPTFASAVKADITEVLKSYPTRSVMSGAVEHATELITGGLGGYVVFNMDQDGKPQEILIMDTDDTSTAVNVWRFNRNGLGHSHSGYDGPYDDVALTADGQINAAMITTGTMSANHVRAGLITDQQGNNSWNLDTGYLNTQSGKIGNFSISGGMLQGDATTSDYGVRVAPTYISWYSGAVEWYRIRALSQYLDLSGYNGTAFESLMTVYSLGSNRGIRLLLPTTVNNDFTVTGTKNRLVKTQDYGERLMYAYETASPMFGDVGEGEIAEDGLCYVAIDPCFAQTVSLAQYQVFLQAYGNGRVYVKERSYGHFLVAGDAGMKFGWEVKAKQKDYDQRRIDQPMACAAVNDDYGGMAMSHIQSIYRERDLA